MGCGGEGGVVGAQPVGRADGLVDAVVAGVGGDVGVGAQYAQGEPDGGEGAVVDVVREVFGDPGQVVAEVGGAAGVGLDGGEAEPVGLGQQLAEGGASVSAGSSPVPASPGAPVRRGSE